MPKKGAKSYPAANFQFDEDPTKLKIHSEIFSYLKKHLARYTLEPKGIRGIQQLLGDRILLLFDQPTFVGEQKKIHYLTPFPPLILSTQLKFIYSEKATKFCEIFTLLLSFVVPVKSKVKISQNFVAFSEYMNFIKIEFFFFSRDDQRREERELKEKNVS